MAVELKTSFKVPEGRYALHTSKPASVPFQMRRATRLTVATLHGGEEEGMYMVYNVGDFLHVAPFDATDKDPLVSLIFNPSAVRDGYPCCHAYQPAKDGCDLLVGIANGEVMLLSLRAQLQLQGGTRPVIAAQPNADNLYDSSRVNVLLWVPSSKGVHFIAGHASGNLLVYKKTPAMIGESSSKLLSHLSSKGNSSNAVTTIHVPCGGINDAAFSPDGSKLAVASRDGSVRLLDWPSGTCIGGYSSYYGAALCVSWSPDAAFVASGGEDDLVAAYSLADRQVVAFGEGHTSWVTRVAFDPWACGEATTSSPPMLPGPAAGASPQQQQQQSPQQQQQQLHEQFYRLGSVGQDTTLCLWDLLVEVDPDAPVSGPGATGGGLKRVASQSQLNIPTVSSSANLAATQQQHQQQLQAQLQQQQEQPYQQYQQYQQQQAHQHHPTPGHSRSTSDGGLAGFAAISGSRSASGNLLSLLKQQPHGGGGGAPAVVAAPVAPSMPRAEMTLLPPAMQQRIHSEPVTDILFTEEAIFTACSSGSIKCWLRPGLS